MSPTKPHIWLYWDRLFTSVPTEPIFCILVTNWIPNLSSSRPRSPSKNQMRWKNNKITDLEYGFRKLILGLGWRKLSPVTQILVNWTFITILRILSILLQYSYSARQIRGIVLNQDQRIQSPGLVIQVKVAISRELREPNPFLLFYILILQSLPPRFYLYHNLMSYYTIFII